MPIDTTIPPAADPIVPPATDPPAPGTPPADPPPPADEKDAARQGFRQRELEKQLADLKRENETFKAAQETQRKAKLTEEQRVKEEVESLKAEAARLKTENLQRKIGAEFGLPEALTARLQGSDEEALRADAEGLAALLPKRQAGTHQDPATGDSPRTYKESQIADRAFFLKHKDDIYLAQAEGRILLGE